MPHHHPSWEDHIPSDNWWAPASWGLRARFSLQLFLKLPEIIKLDLPPGHETHFKQLPEDYFQNNSEGIWGSKIYAKEEFFEECREKHTFTNMLRESSNPCHPSATVWSWHLKIDSRTTCTYALNKRKLGSETSTKLFKNAHLKNRRVP